MEKVGRIIWAVFIRIKIALLQILKLLHILSFEVVKWCLFMASVATITGMIFMFTKFDNITQFMGALLDQQDANQQEIRELFLSEKQSDHDKKRDREGEKRYK